MSKVQLHAWVLVILLILAGMGAKSSRLAVTGHVTTDFSKIPLEVGGYTGRDEKFDPEVYRLLPSCSLLMRYYERDDDLPITLAIVYGTDLGDFHQPEMCLEGGGLHTIRRGTARVRDAQGKPFQAVSLIMESDYDRQAFVFWFSSEGTTATFLGSYKVKVFLNRLFARKVQPSALIRLSTLALDSDEEAVSRLVRFAEALQPYLKQEFTAEGTD